ncbi:MAG: NifU family protein [Deltaproteobacteria bacterium]|nr:NifU family protein [Deltaproteobacteria bacterium]
MKVNTTDFLKHRKESRPCFVFDLRGMDDFEKEHLMGAHNLPFEYLESNLHRLPFNGELLFYDGGEGLAEQAAKILDDNGFTEIFFTAEGYEKVSQTLRENPDFELRMSCTGNDSLEVKMEVIQNLLDLEINPMVASHGGHFSLVGIEGNKVLVELSGGCQGCGMADMTLYEGVETRMREVFPDLEALVDTTDHSQGENPYHQP